MSEPDRTTEGYPGDWPPSGDSPKRHGDKPTGTPRGSKDGPPSVEGADQPSGDSPKRHGDKLASAGRRATVPLRR